MPFDAIVVFTRHPGMARSLAYSLLQTLREGLFDGTTNHKLLAVELSDRNNKMLK